MKWLKDLLGIGERWAPKLKNPPTPPERKKEIAIGVTTHCVNCAKLLPKENYVSTGHLKYRENQIVMANFCNDWCIRELTFKKHDWNGMWWIEDYGLKRHEEQFEI